MSKLTRADLYSLEDYARERAEFRARVMRHKRPRAIAVGPHVTLYFEDRLTMQYQIQEILRAERIFEPDGIDEELAAYNPLIPDGSNWKATQMLEYPDPEARRDALTRLVGIEDCTWVKVAGFDRVMAIADEDLERDTADKTSAVHFVRFELSVDMTAALHDGAAVAIGIEHANYTHRVDPVEDAARRALLEDLTTGGGTS